MRDGPTMSVNYAGLGLAMFHNERSRVCMYEWMHVCMYVYVLCVYACICVVYVCMYVCIPGFIRLFLFEQPKCMYVVCV